ncbi:hypothetical protein HTSR_1460 [Halodesulfurarchaeum formicicum]|uniref:Uncharacterized protein n=1 Tax=Halodesulfurarchaeum formicicum TaxID=1873524 RepID=A0A1D8S5K4_9EURY|nr:DUF5791 family protein [Halodesulfurarchaeum formicicum]AOW80636.1 hypothetical protein HTSR_1460 [Halodesulfurarchaeum formicicum]APE95975.1 hypothetical protein HSR6_1532 [Halodesulfurarchaeum formicicum]
MTEPPLTAFLRVPERCADPITVSLESFETLRREYRAVLATVVRAAGVDAVAAATGLDREPVASLQASTDASSTPSLTIDSAAAILAVESSLSEAEIGERIREDLQVEMARVPIDLTALVDAHALGDRTTLRAQLAGQRPLSLRSYARIRAILWDSARS